MHSSTILLLTYSFALPTAIPHEDDWTDDPDQEIYTNTWAVELREGNIDPDAMAESHGFTNLGEVIPGSNAYEFERPDVSRRSFSPADDVALLDDVDVIEARQQVLERQESKAILLKERSRLSRVKRIVSPTEGENLFNDPL